MDRKTEGNRMKPTLGEYQLTSGGPVTITAVYEFYENYVVTYVEQGNREDGQDGYTVCPWDVMREKIKREARND